MSLTWQDVACGLPGPELPVLDGWHTRFFAAALVLSGGQVETLRSVTGRLLGEGPAGRPADRPVVLMPHGAGADWPCRLVCAPDLDALPDGRWRARLEFEVIEPAAGAKASVRL